MSQQRNRFNTARLVSLLAVALTGLVAGCRTEPAAGGRLGPASVSHATDPCAENMHELSGYLLQYYVMHNTMPASLSDLQPLVDLDKTLPLACPVSGKPYLYFRDGLVAAGESKHLIVVDPEPSHNGEHWGLVALPPEGKTPLGLWVVHLRPAAVQQFHAP